MVYGNSYIVCISEILGTWLRYVILTLEMKFITNLNLILYNIIDILYNVML